MRHAVLPILSALLCLPGRAERMSWLENDRIKLGIDLDRGGAIVFLASARDGANVINNHDLGRQVQLSFYSGPVPFETKGQKPAEHWKHLGWNPIQSGDDFKNPGRVLAHENDGKTLHVACRPMQWPLNNVPGDCTFDSWLELDGAAVKARARLTNARSDHTAYPARLQELPAVYANASFHRVVSYQGSQPFTGDAFSTVPKAGGRHPWSFWTGTEGWSALLDGKDYGLGLISPGRVHFTGGFAGKPGLNDPLGNSTGYLASQAMEILDHDIVYEFRYDLVLGSVEEIRERAAHWRPSGLPAWRFSSDRQGWHLVLATDAGWPITGQLEVALDRNDPQIVGPHTFWNAAEAPRLVIDAAFRTTQKQGAVFWQKLGDSGFGERTQPFSIVGDGAFHRHVIDLGAHPDYRGSLVRLRIDPVGAGEPGSWMKVRSIALEGAKPVNGPSPAKTTE